MNIYFDTAATTKPSDNVVKTVAEAMQDFYANSDSLHKLGMESDDKIVSCRETIAKSINASKDEIIFTSGGSEGNNLALRGLTKPNMHIITTAFEHSSIINTSKFLENNNIKVTYLSLDSNGFIDIEELKSAITKDTVLVSIMHVNNEIGSIQHLKEIGETIKSLSSRAKFHVDAVQSFGKFPIDVKELKIDALTASGHKINGPKGTGFFYLKKGSNLTPQIIGGQQQHGLRGGTENLPGIMGLTTATVEKLNSMSENYNKVKNIKEYMIERLNEIDNIKINSPSNENFSPYILHVSFLGIRGEVLLHYLSEENIFVSTGSACTSKSKAGVVGSHVLEALHLNKNEIEGAVRFSFSPDNTKEEVDITIDTLKRGLKLLRRVKR